MPIDPSTLSESVSSSFQSLHNAAATLNSVSDELGKFIARIDESLRKLNLGITVWVKVSGWDNSGDGDTGFWTEQIGYAKVNGRWGLCLRRVVGDYRYPEQDSEEIWAFNDAPRVQRLDALDKITDLLQKLSNEADTMTARVLERLADVEAVANAVAPLPLVIKRNGGGVK